MANAGPVGPEDMKMTRLQRERNDVARPRRNAARRHRDQHAAATIAGDRQRPPKTAGDMRLTADPLVGTAPSPGTPRPDRDLLRPDTDPHPRRRAKRPLGLAVELGCADIEGHARTDRQAEAAIRPD